MGIHGLTGFIDNNQHVLQQHQLHDCSVVLDGNNFYHFLYYACNVRCGFGGDYDIFRKKIISTFDSFKICGVTPIVIMDGAYTVDGRKLRTSLSRAAARIRLVDVMTNHQRGQAIPALAYETFMQTLNELNICHITCQFEADNEIAVLANKLQCPVISNDSDFYIFDLSSGFLPLDYLDFRPLKKQNSNGTSISFSYLHCHKYHVDDFINSFDGLSRSVLPVFASLLGNDFINPSAFSTFYSRVKVPKVISKKFSLPPRLSKVISVLHWLHSQNESVEFLDVKRELLEFIKPRRRKIVERLFVTSVNGYVDVTNFQGFDLFQIVTHGADQCQLTALEDFRSYSGNSFPDWFIKAVACGEITPSILNCVILHRVIILTQVEDLSQASSFLCSLGLRRIIYGILFQDDSFHKVNSCHKECAETDKTPYECLNVYSDLSYEKMFTQMTDVEQTLISDLETPYECLHGDSHEKFSTQMTDVEQTLISDVETPYECLHGDSHEKFSTQMTDIEQTLISDVKTPEENKNIKMDNVDDVCDVKEDGLIDDDNDVEVKICENDVAGGGNTVGRQKKLKDSGIEEYTRIKKNLLKSIIEPLFITGNISLPGLNSIGVMTLKNRGYIVRESLGVSEAVMNKFCEDLQLFVACIVMWSRNAVPKITLSHLYSVIAGMFMIKTLASLEKRKGELKEKGVKSGRNGELQEKVDCDKFESNDDFKADIDDDESESKGEKKEKDICRQSGRNCDLTEKSDKHGRNGELREKNIDKHIKVKMNELDDRKGLMKGGNSFKTNVQSQNNITSQLLNGKDELKETDISGASKLSCLVVEDCSINLLEMTTQDGDSIKYDSSSIDIDMICSDTAVHDLDKVRQNLHKYHTKGPTFNHNSHFNPGITHSFAQLQACMVDAINLNKLLRLPFPNIRPAEFINGTFLYNFYVDISTRANIDLFLATMLGRKSSLFSTFELFKNIIVDFVGVDHFVLPVSLSKTQRKRKSKLREKKVAYDEITVENSEEKELSVKAVAGFNIANRFSALSMED